MIEMVMVQERKGSHFGGTNLKYSIDSKLKLELDYIGIHTRCYIFGLL